MVGVGRSNDRVTEKDDGLERPWYGERFGELESSTTSRTYGQRNGYEWSNNRVISRKWQNLEEEQYMWQDMSTRLVDNGKGGDKMRKVDWILRDMDKPLRLGRGKTMGLEPNIQDNNCYRPVPLLQMDQPIGGEDGVPMKILLRTLDSPSKGLSLVEHFMACLNHKNYR
eukprot:Gb_14033 [translate_table: standard]